MTWTWVCKILCDPHRPGRFPREEVLKCTWRYIMDILFCERDKDRNPAKPPSATKPQNNVEVYREMLWKQGLPKHVVAERVRLFAQQQLEENIARAGGGRL